MNRLRLLIAMAAVPVLAPTPTAAVADLSRPGASPLVALVGLVTWLCSGWLLLVLGLSVLEQRPCRGGRVAGALLPRLAPRAVRLAARLLLGTTLVTGTLGSAAARASGPDHGRAAAAAASSLDWPLGPPVPGLDWPAAPSDTAPPPPVAANAPSAAVNVPTPPAVPTGTPGRTLPSAASAGREVVVVRPGDCLWSLAARALGAAATPARTAAAWPTWWSAANRAVIGDDPNLLQPGLRLVPPA